ncbi:MAG: hypothetical protein ACI8ZM_000378 [Crocinitomix sp.]|jgi:hypothetical protein
MKKLLLAFIVLCAINTDAQVGSNQYLSQSILFPTDLYSNKPISSRAYQLFKTDFESGLHILAIQDIATNEYIFNKKIRIE